MFGKTLRLCCFTRENFWRLAQSRKAAKPQSRKAAKAQKKIGAGARLLDGWAREFGCGNLRVGGGVWCA
jgi:hypothetical protein